MTFHYLLYSIMIFMIFGSSNAQGGSLKTFMIQLDGVTVEYKRSISEFDESVPDVLTVVPEKIYKSAIGKDMNFIIAKADPRRSDVRDIFFISQFKKKYEVIDYKYDISGNTIEDVLLWDFDGDKIDEVVLLWSNVDTYQMKIYKLKIINNAVDTVNIYNSHGLGNPVFVGYNRKLCIKNNSLFVLYQYYYNNEIVHKYAKFASNPDDRTKEIYLMPIGVITKEEWVRMEK